MSIALDIILIAVFLLIVNAAAKKGFVKSLLELVAVLAAFFLAVQISPVLSQKVYDSLLEEKIISAIAEKVNETDFAEKTESFVSEMPEFIISASEAVGIDPQEVLGAITPQNGSKEAFVSEITEKIAEPFVTGALTALFFILSVCLLFALFKYFAQLISKAFKLPLVGTANKALGGALGAVKGVFVIIIAAAVLKLAAAALGGTFAEAVSDSRVVGAVESVVPFIKSLIK